MKTAGNERGVRGVGRKGVEKEGIIIFDVFLFSDILHYHVTTYWSFRLLRGGGGGVLPVIYKISRNCLKY